MEIELDERLSAPLDIEALRDLTEWWQSTEPDDRGVENYSRRPQMSPPLCLGWDIHRQWPNDQGFALWRDLMLEFEPPLLAEHLMAGDQRRAVTAEQYEAALVENWA